MSVVLSFLSLSGKGADENAVGRSGSALVRAASNGHVCVLQLLLEAGADDTILDLQGRSALSRAIESGHAGAITVLSRNRK